MVGRSHLLMGLTAGVVIDSFTHISGDPLTMAKSVPLTLLISKAVYYFAVGFGALLPDIDNARSTLGNNLGWISKGIQRIAGHRTLFHSFVGLLIGSILAIGIERLVVFLLERQGFLLPAEFVSASHVFFFGTLFGCIIHIACDALTLGGVPLLWPYSKRFGFPPNPNWRFRTGSWPETVVVYTFIILVGIGIWQAIIVI